MRSKIEQRKLRHQRARARVIGTSSRPRLAVFKSTKHIFAQIINDESGKTLVAFSNLKSKLSAGDVGKELAKKAVELKIKKVVFDKSGFKYHGQIKDLADGAREEGLDF